MSFALVALPLPVRQTFAYRVPEALDRSARPGAQVVVPFRGRRARGFLVERMRSSALEHVHDLAEVLGEPVFSPHLLALARWIADYYMAPPGEVLAAALPGGLEGFAKSRARRAAFEDPVVRMAMPERITLTAAQAAAARAIESALNARAFAPLLLHGVTGSGKTELYLRAAAAARETGGQTLVLVPEVALGSQVVAAFRRRFGGRVGVLHSYLNVGERRRNWELASRGALDIVVGARSAVFAPLPSLRLIVVDEEHEPAYKQSEHLRYHGRDTAVRRAQMLGIPVVLGTATPSLESLANAARGRYRRLRLPERVDRRPMPRVSVVDLRREGAGTLLSRPLCAALGARLERGEQALLFLNRRGHSHHTQCRACGFVPACPHCDITLTLHLAPDEWRCHYCDHRPRAGGACPACGADFPNVTLVGVLDADVALHLPDFRAAERTWQLLVQVGGRAGRGRRPGEVLVQTCTPDHPAIAAAVLGDERPFLDVELAQRRDAGYPPFARLISLRFAGAGATLVEASAHRHAEFARERAEACGVTVLGPAPQALARLRGQHRWHLLLKGGDARRLREVAAHALEGVGAGRGARGVRVSVDVDPVEVL
jgi:primosomal protein N' (replication factor Y)